MPSWIMSNSFLSYADMQNNAQCFYGMMHSLGWSGQAIAAMLGNMESESTINPGIWEGLDAYNYSVGFGLVQWTPATKYINWAGSGWYDGNMECRRIDYEAQNGLQWFANPEVSPSNPPISFAEFKVSTLSVYDLAMYFVWYYEHPADPFQYNRGTQAEYWAEYLSSLPGIPDIPTGGGGDYPVPGELPIDVGALSTVIQRQGGGKRVNLRPKRIYRH